MLKLFQKSLKPSPLVTVLGAMKGPNFNEGKNYFTRKLLGQGGLDVCNAIINIGLYVVEDQ